MLTLQIKQGGLSNMDRFFKDNWFERLQDRMEDMTMGEMLRIQRYIDELSLTDFKGLFGIDRGLMSKYENDKKKPFREHYDILMDYLDGLYQEEIEFYKEGKTA
jgi:hypothetical protein